MIYFDEVKKLHFQQCGDERGSLVVVEAIKEIPFEMKRIFYMYGSTPEVVRGNHANRESEFVMINLTGSCKVKIKDGKGSEKVFSLDKPHTGIYIPKMVWKEMYDFSSDSILLVISNKLYDSSEYIRDYSAYAEEVKKYG